MKKSNASFSNELYFWLSFYTNPIARAETSLFTKKITKLLKKYRPVNLHFEELTAFSLFQVSYKGIPKNKKTNSELNSSKDFLDFLLPQLTGIYNLYLKKLLLRFEKEMKNNKSLKEAISILSKNLILSVEKNTEFTEAIDATFNELTTSYFAVLKEANTYICSDKKNNYTRVEVGGKSYELRTSEKISQLIDELILYNFSEKYLPKTKGILESFTIPIKESCKLLSNINSKTENLEIVLDLLKGKSFESVDNINDLRRQVARQKRAKEDVLIELDKILDPEIKSILNETLPESVVSETTALTAEILRELEVFSEAIRDIEKRELVSEEKPLATDLSESLYELFISMESLRIWSEFFYDISYFTTKRGRVISSIAEASEKTIETDAVLVVDEVYKTYQLPKSRVYALRGISLTIESGEFLAIMGPSGAGKTTLINILTGLDSPDKGTVYLNGKNIAKMDDKRLTEYRRDQIGLVFQFYQLFAELTALENVSMPAEMAAVPVKAARKKAKDILAIVELEKFAEQYPDKLSGGQQQRVAIARALINEPSIIVADQLTGDLDSATGMQIIGYLRKINREKGTTILLATHNKDVAMKADRILVIEDGEIIEELDMKSLRMSNDRQKKDNFDKISS